MHMCGGGLSGVAAVVAGLALFAVAGCGGRAETSQSGALTAARVRSVFAAQGFRPDVVFDTRTASEAQIDRIGPSTDPNSTKRSANAYSRAGLEALVAQGAQHPLTLLSYPWTPESGDMEVLVWGKVADAKTAVGNMKRAAARELAKMRRETRSWLKHHPGGKATVTGGFTKMPRVRNVVVIYDPSVRAKARRVQEALAELTGGD